MNPISYRNGNVFEILEEHIAHFLPRLSGGQDQFRLLVPLSGCLLTRSAAQAQPQPRNRIPEPLIRKPEEPGTEYQNPKALSSPWTLRVKPLPPTTVLLRGRQRLLRSWAGHCQTGAESSFFLQCLLSCVGFCLASGLSGFCFR